MDFRGYEVTDFIVYNAVRRGSIAYGTKYISLKRRKPTQKLWVLKLLCWVAELLRYYECWNSKLSQNVLIWSLLLNQHMYIRPVTNKLEMSPSHKSEPWLFIYLLTHELWIYSLYFIYMQYKKTQAIQTTESGSTIF